MGLFTRLRSRDGLNGKKSGILIEQNRPQTNDFHQDDFVSKQNDLSYSRKEGESSRVYTSSKSSKSPNKIKNRNHSNFERSNGNQQQSQQQPPQQRRRSVTNPLQFQNSQSIPSGLAIIKDEMNLPKSPTISIINSSLNSPLTDRRPSTQSNHSIKTIGSNMTTSNTISTTNSTINSGSGSGSLITSSLLLNNNNENNSPKLLTSSWRHFHNQQHSSPCFSSSSSSSNFSTPFLTSDDDMFQEYSEEIVEDFEEKERERMFLSSFPSTKVLSPSSPINNFTSCSSSSSTTLNGQIINGNGSLGVNALKRASSKLKNGLSLRRPSTTDGSISRSNSLSNFFGVGNGIIDNQNSTKRNSSAKFSNFLNGAMKSTESFNSTISVGSKNTMTTKSKMTVNVPESLQPQSQCDDNNNNHQKSIDETMEIIQNDQPFFTSSSFSQKEEKGIKSRSRTFSSSSTQGIKAAIRASIIRPISRGNEIENNNNNNVKSFSPKSSNFPIIADPDVTAAAATAAEEGTTIQRQIDSSSILKLNDLAATSTVEMNTAIMIKKPKSRREHQHQQQPLSLSPAPRRRTRSSRNTSSSGSGSSYPKYNNNDFISPQEPVPEIPKEFKTEKGILNHSISFVQYQQHSQQQQQQQQQQQSPRTKLINLNETGSPYSSSIGLYPTTAKNSTNGEMFEKSEDEEEEEGEEEGEMMKNGRRKSNGEISFLTNTSSTTASSSCSGGNDGNNISSKTRHTPNSSFSESINQQNFIKSNKDELETIIDSSNSITPTNTTMENDLLMIETNENLLKRYENALKAKYSQEEEQEHPPSFSLPPQPQQATKSKSNFQILIPEQFSSNSSSYLIKQKRRQSQSALP